MMKAFCIIGTDTGVGKTMVTAGLACFFQKRHLNFDVQKWISTGDRHGVSRDLLFVFHVLESAQHDKLCFDPCARSLKKEIDFKYRNPYSFKFPSSPHLAAELENQSIRPEKIKRTMEYFKSRTDYLIIEGIGGLLVPVSKKILLIDLIKRNKLPVILVTPNTLGTINKTLLSIRILKEHKIRILGVVFNEYLRENKKILADNKKIIHRFSGIKILGEIKMMKKKSDLITNFKTIGNHLLKELEKG